MNKIKLSLEKKILIAFLAIVLVIQPAFSVMLNLGNVYADEYYTEVVCYGNDVPHLSSNQSIASSTTFRKWNVTYQGSVDVDIFEDTVNRIRSSSIAVNNVRNEDGSFIYLKPYSIEKIGKTQKKWVSNQMSWKKYAKYRIVYKYSTITDWTSASNFEDLHLSNLTANYNSSSCSFSVTVSPVSWRSR